MTAAATALAAGAEAAAEDDRDRDHDNSAQHAAGDDQCFSETTGHVLTPLELVLCADPLARVPVTHRPTVLRVLLAVDPDTEVSPASLTNLRVPFAARDPPVDFRVGHGCGTFLDRGIAVFTGIPSVSAIAVTPGGLGDDLAEVSAILTVTGTRSFQPDAVKDQVVEIAKSAIDSPGKPLLRVQVQMRTFRLR
jgi:hypothetical protein